MGKKLCSLETQDTWLQPHQGQLCISSQSQAPVRLATTTEHAWEGSGKIAEFMLPLQEWSARCTTCLLQGPAGNATSLLILTVRCELARVAAAERGGLLREAGREAGQR